jgi:hypothetical protein
MRSTTWHKLIHWGQNKHVWSKNVQVVRNTCPAKNCPGKPLLMQGFIQRELLWYAPQDIVQSVHVTNGELKIEDGCGQCGTCNREF